MFKNLSVYRFDPNDERCEGLMTILQSADDALAFFSTNEPVDPQYNQIECIGIAQVDAHIIEQCTDVLENSYTFLPITLVIRQRAIDNAAVKCMTERKVKEISARQGRVVGRKERQTIKDEILLDLIPKAPIKEKHIAGYVTSDGYILIDASGKPAELYLSAIRNTVGGLLTTPEENLNIHQYCYNKVREYFYTAPEETEEGSTVATGSFMFTHGDEKVDIRNCDSETFTDELNARFLNGHTVWCALDNDQVEFRLTDTCTLKSIKLGEMSYEPVNDEDGHLSAAYHRFYLEFFRNTFNSLIADIRETTV